MKSYFSQDNSAAKDNKNHRVKNSSSLFNETDNCSIFPKINEKALTNFKKNQSFTNCNNSNAFNYPGIRINYQYLSNNENINKKSGKEIPNISIYSNSKHGKIDKLGGIDKELTPIKLNSESMKNVKGKNDQKQISGENCLNDNSLKNNIPQKLKINSRANSDTHSLIGVKNGIKTESLIIQSNFDKKLEKTNEFYFNQPFNMNENSFGKLRLTSPGLKINLNYLNETEKSINKDILNKIPFKVDESKINVIKENEEEYSNNISDRCYLKEKSLKNNANSISIKNKINSKIDGENILPSEKHSFNSKLNLEKKEETFIKHDPCNVLEEKYGDKKNSENENQIDNFLEKKYYTQKNIIEISNENSNNIVIIEENINEHKKSNSFSKENNFTHDKNLANNKFRKNKALNFDHSNDSIVYSDNEIKNNYLINNKNKVDNINYFITEKIGNNINSYHPNNQQKHKIHNKRIKLDNHSKENNLNSKST